MPRDRPRWGGANRVHGPVTAHATCRRRSVPRLPRTGEVSKHRHASGVAATVEVVVEVVVEMIAEVVVEVMVEVIVEVAASGGQGSQCLGAL